MQNWAKDNDLPHSARTRRSHVYIESSKIYSRLYETMDNNPSHTVQKMCERNRKTNDHHLTLQYVKGHWMPPALTTYLMRFVNGTQQSRLITITYTAQELRNIIHELWDELWHCNHFCSKCLIITVWWSIDRDKSQLWLIHDMRCMVTSN